MQIITRATAKALGLTRYFTGKPCKHGHICERFTKGGCVKCGAQFYARWSSDPHNKPKRRALDARWYSNNRDIKMERSLTWAKNNPAKDKARRQRRRALKLSAQGTFTPHDWIVLVARSPHCHWCKKTFNSKRRRTHDHVIPVTKGGDNTLENSVCACRSCNSRKNNRLVNPVTGQGILL